MDIKSTFLNGELEAEVYIEQLEGPFTYWQEGLCLQVKEGFIQSQVGS